MPAGEIVEIELIPETTQQREGAKGGTGAFVHGFVRHAFGLASVLAVVLVDLVLKLAFPIRVVAHRSLSTGQASKGDRHTVRKPRHGVLAVAVGGAAERRPSRAGCCPASEAIDGEGCEAGDLRGSGRGGPRGRSKVDRVIALT